MKINPWLIVIPVIILIGISLAVNRRNAGLNRELEKKWENERELLVVKAKNNLDSAERWKGIAIARGARVAQLDTMLNRANSTKDSIVLYQEQVVQLRTQVDEWQNAYRLLKMARLNEFERANLNEKRVAIYQQALSEALRSGDCRLLGIGFLPRCPSRTVSLVLGAAVASTAFVLTR